MITFLQFNIYILYNIKCTTIYPLRKEHRKAKMKHSLQAAFQHYSHINTDISYGF